MGLSKWVYSKATGEYLYGGFYEPSQWDKVNQPTQLPGHYDPDTEAVDEFDGIHPDPRRERHGATPNTRRGATAPEIAAWDAKQPDNIRKARAQQMRSALPNAPVTVQDLIELGLI